MNAKEIKTILEKREYNSLNQKEREEVVKFILKHTFISDRGAAINILKGGMIKSVYKTFLNKIEEKYNNSQKRLIAIALEPIYGKIEEEKEENKGGEKEVKITYKCSSDEHWEAFKRMPSDVRRTYMKRLRRDNPILYKELSKEINLLNKYKGNPKPHYNQNLNNGLGHIKMKNKDGSFTYY